MTNFKNFSCLEEEIGYHFTDKGLLETAMTHSSYSNEKGTPSYERLEFLGDAVLQILISKCLYFRFSDLPEGMLTRFRQDLVCEKTLADLARSLSLGDYLLLGKGEEAGNGRNRPSILADTVESLLAAVYLDGGIEKAETILLSWMKEKLEHCEDNKLGDCKTRLQQLIEQDGNETLSYRVVSREGPDHKPVYVMEAVISGNPVGTGRGSSKHEAEQAAAREALRYFGIL